MTQDFRSHWCLNPSVAYLNHGSDGACPRAVLQIQQQLQLELEEEPIDFLERRLPSRLDAARAEVASFLSARPDDLVFVTNATSGVNAVLRSLEFSPGDELLTISHAYNACRKALDYVAARSGARVVTAVLPFPLADDEEVISAVLACVTPRTRLALLDHVTSPSALVLPIARLVAELRSRGIETLVDGAHAPGMLPVALTDLGAAYYTGNAHKWLCAPKGAAFLHVRSDCQADLHPLAISHGYGAGFHAEFDWTGTCDPTPWLCIPAAIRYLGNLLPGGWPAVMSSNRSLALRARERLTSALGIDAPCPAGMVGSMAAVPLPRAAPGSPASELKGDALASWFRNRGVEPYVAAPPYSPPPLSLLRVSAQLYNTAEDIERLIPLVLEAVHGALASG